MRLSQIEFNNHPILKNLKIDFTNPENGNIYANIIFVGENGCGKTTLLNELFNYDNSEYIVNREQNYNMCGPCSHKSLFIAQDLKYRNAINSICEKTAGKNIYKDITDINNTNNSHGTNIMSLNKNNIVNSAVLLKENVKKFNNKRISEYFEENRNQLMNDASQLVKIDGDLSQVNADTFSSGEQELILRLESIKNRVQQNLDMILLDEPETGLHPKWQLEIVPFILKILKDNQSGERDLQLFISSHSENILKSVFNQPDTLIVGLYKGNGEIKSQNITGMDTRLLEPTIAEIQYLVFDIVSTEYHNQLYGRLLYLCNENKEKLKQEEVEKYLKKEFENELNQILNPYNYHLSQKEIETLPTYIRNASSHPENFKRHYNDDDIKKSIKLLRDVIQKIG